MKLRYKPGTLADRRLELIEEWAHQMRTDHQIGPLGMTMKQRRVVAGLMWHREANRSNEHMGARQQPPPIVGLDARDRIVVQTYDDMGDYLKIWALTKNGDPTDIHEPVFSLKSGERVRMPKSPNVRYQ